MLIGLPCHLLGGDIWTKIKIWQDQERHSWQNLHKFEFREQFCFQGPLEPTKGCRCLQSPSLELSSDHLLLAKEHGGLTLAALGS